MPPTRESATSRLRTIALPHVADLVGELGESANLIIRTGDTARFIASVECTQALRVGNREGMAFPAHRVTGGLVLLAELRREQVDSIYAAEKYVSRPDQRPDLGRLHRELRKIRASGFAINHGLSERGVVAVGRPVRNADGEAVAGLSISMPSVRYDPHQIPIVGGRPWAAQRDETLEAELAPNSLTAGADGAGRQCRR